MLMPPFFKGDNCETMSIGCVSSQQLGPQVRFKVWHKNTYENVKNPLLGYQCIRGEYLHKSLDI